MTVRFPFARRVIAPARLEVAAQEAALARELAVDVAPGIPRLTVLLVIAGQLADLATFGIAASHVGTSGEIGPLGSVYRVGGFAAVALVKSGAILAMIAMLLMYARRTGHGRWLALAVAGVGLFGALTNVIALV